MLLNKHRTTKHQICISQAFNNREPIYLFQCNTRFLRYAKREHILVSETYCVINHIHRYHHPIIFAAILPPREHHYSPHDMV